MAAEDTGGGDVGAFMPNPLSSLEQQSADSEGQSEGVHFDEEDHFDETQHWEEEAVEVSLVGALKSDGGRLAKATVRRANRVVNKKKQADMDAANAVLTADQLRVLFDTIDADGNGVLCASEVKELILSTGDGVVEYELTDERLELDMREMQGGGFGRERDAFDADADEEEEITVTFDDFKDWFRKRVESAKTNRSSLAELIYGNHGTILEGAEDSRCKVHWIHPDLPFKRLWDSVMILVLIYIGVSMPYRLAFDRPAHGLYFLVAVVYEMMLLADVFLNWRTGEMPPVRTVRVPHAWRASRDLRDSCAVLLCCAVLLLCCGQSTPP